MQLDENQLAVANSIIKDISDGAKVVTLGGYAGTGKTTLIKYLLSQLPGWSVSAFTGKAVSVLKSKGIPANTIHQTLYQPISEPPKEHEIDLTKPKNEEIEFSSKGNISPGFIVDEASMVTRNIYADFLSTHMPVIYVGDHGQLPPVQKDDESFNIMSDPDYRLEKLHRNAGPIARFAEYLRKGGKPRFYKSDSDKVIMGNSQIPDSDILNSDAILCSKNDNVKKLNEYYRQLKNYKDVLVTGEKLMALQNYHPYIFNGEMLKIDSINYAGRDYVSITFTKDREKVTININRHQFNHSSTINCPKYIRKDDFVCKNMNFILPCQYGYAMTVHKSQGSEFNQVMVIDDLHSNRFSPMAKNYEKWAYTAASRAKEKLFWIIC